VALAGEGIAVETTCWWQRRRDGEATAVYLGRVLEDLGARDLAIKARRCHYDDYFCPDTVDDGFNIHRLIFELENWSRSATRDQRDRAKVMIRAARDGEFDGTREESEQWATSETGQEVFRELTESARDIKP
jgi:hypothetical protein